MNNERLTRAALIHHITHGATTGAEIARRTGLTRQAVSLALKRHGINLNETPRSVAMKHFPWEIRAPFNNTYENRVARDHLEYMATAGEGLQLWKLERLRGFYDRISRENVVIEFDPAFPPSGLREGLPPGHQRTIGGFAWKPRRPSDRDLIIRVNRHTNLGPEDEPFWRMPPRLPLD